MGNSRAVNLCLFSRFGLFVNFVCSYIVKYSQRIGFKLKDNTVVVIHGKSPKVGELSVELVGFENRVKWIAAEVRIMPSLSMIAKLLLGRRGIPFD